MTDPSMTDPSMTDQEQDAANTPVMRDDGSGFWFGEHLKCDLPVSEWGKEIEKRDALIRADERAKVIEECKEMLDELSGHARADDDQFDIGWHDGLITAGNRIALKSRDAAREKGGEG